MFGNFPPKFHQRNWLLNSEKQFTFILHQLYFAVIYHLQKFQSPKQTKTENHLHNSKNGNYLEKGLPNKNHKKSCIRPSRCAAGKSNHFYWILFLPKYIYLVACTVVHKSWNFVCIHFLSFLSHNEISAIDTNMWHLL